MAESYPRFASLFVLIRHLAAGTISKSEGAMRLGDIATLSFAGAVTVSEVDILTAEQASDLLSSSAISLDFRETTFVEPPALQAVIALCRQLMLRGARPSIRIPRNKKVRDMWRAWHFAPALSAATGVDHFELFDKQDHYWFTEPATDYRSIEYGETKHSPTVELYPYNYFPFTGYNLDRYGPPSARVANEAKQAWSAPHIMDVLKRKIGRGASHFPSVVVFESILNSTRHPRATIVQTASFDQSAYRGGAVASKSQVDKKSTFTTHFWDDGESMADKLHQAIVGGVKVRTNPSNDFERNYLLRFEDPENNVNSTTSESSSQALGIDISEHLSLLAALFPSVTSSPSGSGNQVPAEILREDARFGNPGMGLFVLTRTVVEMFGGSIAFRTGRYFMNVRPLTKPEKKANPEADIRVKIQRQPSSVPAFLGNMVTIRLKYSESPKA